MRLQAAFRPGELYLPPLSKLCPVPASIPSKLAVSPGTDHGAALSLGFQAFDHWDLTLDTLKV